MAMNIAKVHVPRKAMNAMKKQYIELHFCDTRDITYVIIEHSSKAKVWKLDA